MRVRRCQPVLGQLKAWVDLQKPLHLPEGPMGAALRYISNQWKPLTVFMGDPKIPIHNNASESALRIIAVDVSLCTLSSSTRNLERAIVPGNARRATGALATAA